MTEYAPTAIFYSSDRAIELQNLPIPPLKTGEILVKNEYTTLCRSDLNTFCGKRIEKSPTILGHEIVGRIAGFGPDTVLTDLRGTQLAIGQRVSWAIFASHPDSPMAQKGIPQKSDDLFKYGHEQLTDDSVLHGGLSKFTLLRPHTPILVLDEAIPVTVAATINCAVATIAGAMRLAGSVQNKNVLVVGAGMLGCIATAFCRVNGAAEVAAMDISEQRLQESLAFGANHLFLANDSLQQAVKNAFGSAMAFDIVIEVSGAISAMEQTLDLLSIGGTAVWVGATFPQAPVKVDAEKMVRRLLTIKGLHNYNREDFVSAVAFMEKHHSTFPFSRMVHDQFSLSEVNEAFAFALSANPFRVGIRIK